MSDCGFVPNKIPKELSNQIKSIFMCCNMKYEMSETTVDKYAYLKRNTKKCSSSGMFNVLKLAVYL